MAPRKKRKQSQTNQVPSKKRKEDEDCKRSSSGNSSDNDDVQMISPPKRQLAKTRDKPGKQISTQSSGPNIELLKQNWKPIPVKSVVFLHDLEKHEGVLRKLGLLDIYNLEFDSEPCCDELAELVISYNGRSHTSQVRGARIKVNKLQLANALGLACRKERNLIDVAELEASPRYAIADCKDDAMRAVLYVVSNRVCPTSDDSLTFTEIVEAVEKAVREDFTVDWATLVWSRAEKELLQGQSMGSFFYACHFQKLIRMSRPSVSCDRDDEEETVKTKSLKDLDSENDVKTQETAIDPEETVVADSENEKDIENGVGDSIKSQENLDEEGLQGPRDVTDGDRVSNPLATNEPSTAKGADQNKNANLDSIQDEENAEHGHENVDPTQEEQNKNTDQKPFDVDDMDIAVTMSSQDASMIRFLQAEQGLSEPTKGITVRSERHLVNSTSVEVPVTDLQNGMFASSASIPAEQQVMNLHKESLITSSAHAQITESDARMTSEIDRCTSLNLASNLQRTISQDNGIQINSRTSPQPALSDPFCVMSNQVFHSNTRNRDTNGDDELHITSEKSNLPLNFEFCMNKVLNWLKRAHDAHLLEKDSITRTYEMEIQNLSEQLRQREYTIGTIHMNKSPEVQQLQMECLQLKHRLNLTSKTFIGYRVAVEEARQTIDLYRQGISQKEAIISHLEQRLQEAMEENQLLKEKTKQTVFDNESKEKMLTDKSLAHNESLEPKAEQTLPCVHVDKDQELIEQKCQGVEDSDKEPVKPGTDGDDRGTESLKPEKHTDVNDGDKESLKLEKSVDVDKESKESSNTEKSMDVQEENKESLKPDKGTDMDDGDKDSLKPQKFTDIDAPPVHNLIEEKGKQVLAEDKESMKSQDNSCVFAGCQKLDGVDSVREIASNEAIDHSKDEPMT